MKSLLTILALSLAASASAAEPGLEIRLRPAADFIAQFEYVGAVVGQAEQAKQLADVIKVFGGDKGVIEGIDLKRPIGAYVVFTPTMVDSQIVAMLPVANEKAFMNLLTMRLFLKPEKQDGGAYFVQVPNVGPALYFRFHKDYVCITIQEPKHIDADKLLDPKTFFAVTEPALVAITLHVERLPAEVRKQVLGQFELALNEKASQLKKDAGAVERLAHWMAVDGLPRAVKSLVNEGKTLNVKLMVEPKTDDLTLAVTVTAKDGSDLKSTFTGLSAKPALAARAAEAKAPVASLAINAGLPEAMKKGLTKHADEAINEAIRDANADGRDVLEKLFDALGPTLKDGDYEFGAALTGTPADGKLRLVAAAKAVDGKELEKLVKDFAGFLPPELAKIEFDAAKLAAGNLHKIIAGNDDLKRLYGSENAWALWGDTLYVLGLEPDGTEAKRVAALKAGTADMLNVRIAWTRFVPVTDPGIEKGMNTELTAAVFGSGTVPDGADETSLSVRGGKNLTVQLKLKGKAIQYLAALDKKKKEK